MGFPIRRSLDQSSFAAPQGISQRTTSFIASQRQGIHQMLLRHLITLTIDVRKPSAKRADMIIKERPVLGFLPRHLFACQTYPAHAAAGRGWFARTRTPDWPNMLPLYDFKHPRSHPKGEITNLMTRSIQGWTPDTQTPPKQVARPRKVVEPVGIEPTT